MQSLDTPGMKKKECRLQLLASLLRLKNEQPFNTTNMMKTVVRKSLLAGLLLSMGGALFAQQYTTRQDRVEPFVAIKVSGNPKVIYSQDSKMAVEVYGNPDLVNILETKVDKGVLLVRFTKKNVRITDKDKLEVRVSAPLLKEVSLTGSGDVIFRTPFRSNQDLTLSLVGSGDVKTELLSCANLRLKLGGSGDVEIDKAACGKLAATLSGSGDLQVESADVQTVEATLVGSGDLKIGRGKAQWASYRVTGSGDLEAEDLVASKVDAQVTGSGSIECSVTDELNAQVTGSGGIGYRGNPSVLNTSRRGVKRVH